MVRWLCVLVGWLRLVVRRLCLVVGWLCVVVRWLCLVVGQHGQCSFCRSLCQPAECAFSDSNRWDQQLGGRRRITSDPPLCLRRFKSSTSRSIGRDVLLMLLQADPKIKKLSLAQLAACPRVAALPPHLAVPILTGWFQDPAGPHRAGPASTVHGRANIKLEPLQ